MRCCFFWHILHKEFGEIDGVVRAMQKRYVPVVLSREQIDAILAHLSPPYYLVVHLLYGCGLRLFECSNLRVHCFNFDAGVLNVRDGKGQKDRTIPLPQTILQELQTHLELNPRAHSPQRLDLSWSTSLAAGLASEPHKLANSLQSKISCSLLQGASIRRNSHPRSSKDRCGHGHTRPESESVSHLTGAPWVEP